MLDEWIRANARDAQGMTVELVWRLVAASCPAPTHRRFPLSDSIGQHGPDGELDAPVGSPPFVPDGRSYWEIGTNLDARSKANSDYNDLTAAVPREVRSCSAFVFVTPLSGRRDWQNTWKEEGIATWVEARRNRNEWADVKVLNGASLIDWLYRFPAVERWLAGQMGLRIDFIETLDARWETVRMIGSPPPLTHDLFIANRASAAQKLHKLIIEREGTQLKLDTRHPEHAGDFVSAYAWSLDEERRVEVTGRCLIVTQEGAWSNACSLNESHVLIADFDIESEKGTKLIQGALNRRHAVVFPGMPGGVPHANRVSLPMPNEHQIREALEKGGYPPERARRLSNACRSDLNSLLRCLQGLSAAPEWSLLTESSEIAIAMLIASWREDFPADCSAVEGVVGKQYGEWIPAVRRLASTYSTPLSFRNGAWRMASRFEAWQVLGSRVYDDVLTRFVDTAVSVLREIDPSLELTPDQRFAAGVYGKARAHSPQLRKALAETLALCGAQDKALSSCSEGGVERKVRSAVGSILANGDWRVWSSVDDVLPLLAEASPEAFLDSVSAAIRSDSEPFQGVFAQETSGTFGRIYITGLLWGLETLAWDARYLVQVCRILSDLAARDPGGNWSNRPANSLITILLPWLPQTCATADKRHAAARVVATKRPEIGWKLICSLLPNKHSVSSGTHKPVWREFIPQNWNGEVSETQYLEDVTAYGELALELAGADVGRIGELVGDYFSLPANVQIGLRDRMTSGLIIEQSEDARFLLWQALNQLTTNHRKFAEYDNWNVPEEALEELEGIAERLRPAAPEIRHKRIFGAVEADLYEEMGNWEEQEQALNRRRQDAVREIVVRGGTSLLLSFATEVGEPWRVGFAYGSIAELANDKAVLPVLLESTEKGLHQFAGGYVLARHRTGGWQWVDSVDMEMWNDPVKGQFFAFLPFCEETWARVEIRMAEGQSTYWQNASVNPYDSISGLDAALKKLIENDRPDGVIRCIQMMLHNRQPVNAGTAVVALRALNPQHRLDAYAIGKVLTFLQTEGVANESDVRDLELKFMPILGRFNHGQPVFLWRWLAEDPMFFCEVIRMLYRSKKGERPEPSEEGKAKATVAYRLLSEWSLPPGTMKDGSFCAESLKKWVAAVKEECIESGHWEVAATQIGQVLRYAQVDEGGLWIESVCALLDEEDHDRMRSGITMEIFNGRGVYSPDGGKWETAAAEKWSSRADRAEIKGFVLLAEQLRRLATSYRQDAEREGQRNDFELE